jgi:hypothetical protein
MNAVAIKNLRVRVQGITRSLNVQDLAKKSFISQEKRGTAGDISICRRFKPDSWYISARC